jgi:hypothetical protein
MCPVRITTAARARPLPLWVGRLGTGQTSESSSSRDSKSLCTHEIFYLGTCLFPGSLLTPEGAGGLRDAVYSEKVQIFIRLLAAIKASLSAVLNPLNSDYV